MDASSIDPSVDEVQPEQSVGSPKADSNFSSASEYALIFGAGASAAMSLAAQQVAAASVPVTALVAIGLLNRRRLDQQVRASESKGPIIEQKSARASSMQQQVTSQPLPESMATPMRPQVTAAPSQVRFSGKQQRIMAAKESLTTAQTESLRQIGAHLQQVRLQQSLSLQDIHNRTYIQRYALQAIEAGDLAALPEPFYIRAFLQKYAIALGLKGREIAASFPVV